MGYRSDIKLPVEDPFVEDLTNFLTGRNFEDDEEFLITSPQLPKIENISSPTEEESTTSEYAFLSPKYTPSLRFSLDLPLILEGMEPIENCLEFEGSLIFSVHSTFLN